ncbi:MAG TPA: AAA family ATPase [Candidatus Saccharimonadales bacterium]|nr:AAA family ATPase [Candidatus Saccharimonadales bacterium]
MQIVSVALRNFKCYQSTEIVPLFFDNKRFTGFIGENGVGKSAVLEGLYAFFTGQRWLRNKTGKKGEGECGVAPIIECDEEDLKKLKLSSGELEELVKYSPTLHKALATKGVPLDGKKLYISCITYLTGVVRLFDGIAEIKGSEDIAKAVRELILTSFKYVYINAEVDIDDGTNINSETTELIKGTGIVSEITQILKNSPVSDGKRKIGLADLINERIARYLEDEVVKKLQEVDSNYNYKSPKTGGQSKLSEKLISELAAQALFGRRVLTKQIKGKSIGIHDMSSGQRRKAFLDFIGVMIDTLEQNEKRRIILAIDEPEISVDAGSKIQQFDKLLNLSQLGSSVVFTTHWYGWIAQVIDGSAVLIEETDDGRQLYASSVDNLLDKVLKDKAPYEMRMIFDFLSSLGSWAERSPNIRFVICEGQTDYNYLKKHFSGYKIKPVHSRDEVIRMYRLFSDYYLKVGKKPANIIFLVDTDPEKSDELRTLEKSEGKNLRRISRDSNGDIKIVTSPINYTEKCAIEDVLSPRPLLSAMKKASGELPDESDRKFIEDLEIKYPDLSGTEAFGVDDRQKRTLRKLYKVNHFKARISEYYEPNDEEKQKFIDTMELG